MCLMARSTIPTRSSSTRVETGCFSSVELAADHGGAQTERARQNFRVGRDRMPLSIIHALGIVKLAREANGALGSRDQRRDRAIVRAGRKVIDGNLDGQLTLVAWQTNTQTDLNLNGVIGNRANALLGGELGSKSSVQQNDHVDMRRPPSSDSFPTATHIAAVRHIVSDLVPASEVQRAPRGEEPISSRSATPIPRTQRLSRPVRSFPITPRGSIVALNG
jgi:fumarate hydratase class II